MYKMRVYIVASVHVHAEILYRRCIIISIHEEAINLYNLFITIIP